MHVGGARRIAFCDRDSVYKLIEINPLAYYKLSLK